MSRPLRRTTFAYAQALTEYQLLLLTRDEDTYEVYNMSELLDTLDDVMSTLSLKLGVSPRFRCSSAASAL
jgi:hypothetical protein